MQLGKYSQFSFHIQSNSYPGAAWDGIKGEGRAAASGGADDGAALRTDFHFYLFLL
jgi:hypothetical protein